MRSTATESFCRAELERCIEEMIALLDLMDGDTDLEDGGDDEPSITSPAIAIGNRIENDLEFETDDYELSGDDMDYNSGMLMGGAGV
ncbi:hypothetical protein [Shinella sp. HZN7]|uniref:hypothetical protein n=1 Tax=Shinella sp. (strain HZN7) TaxID=879274 RepID=UPI0007DA9692|nr:hypothetical protein [Shinella sp. HZN7]ANH05805.1 hypothetical protein shn_18390 [Shinella sp. HZN7]